MQKENYHIQGTYKSTPDFSGRNFTDQKGAADTFKIPKGKTHNPAEHSSSKIIIVKEYNEEHLSDKQKQNHHY